MTKANMVKGNLCSELQGMSTAQSTMTEKRAMKIARAVYSFLRKVIAPYNKQISFKYSFNHRLLSHAKLQKRSVWSRSTCLWGVDLKRFTYWFDVSVDLLHTLLDALLCPWHHFAELLVLFGVSQTLPVNFDFLSMELNFVDLGQDKIWVKQSFAAGAKAAVPIKKQIYLRTSRWFHPTRIQQLRSRWWDSATTHSQSLGVPELVLLVQTSVKIFLFSLRNFAIDYFV